MNPGLASYWMGDPGCVSALLWALISALLRVGLVPVRRGCSACGLPCPPPGQRLSLKEKEAGLAPLPVTRPVVSAYR